MSYSITLTDEEYAALSAVAAQSGKTVDELAHEALAVGVTPPAFVCADVALLGIASAEGLVAENPNVYP